MIVASRLLMWVSVVQCLEIFEAHYANSTINKARLISDDFRYFQKTGQRVSGRDGRRLISFDTKNDNIEVGLEFAVPFLSIPVKRSVDTMKSWASQTTTFVSNPILNINTGAIALTGAVFLGGLATTFIWKSFMKDQLNFVNNPQYFPHGRQNSPFEDENPLIQFMERLDRIFYKYNIDVTTCVQRIICINVRNAVENVARGTGTSMEKIFDGLTSTWLLRRLTAGTAISDAITAGQRSANCEKKFSECNMKSKNVQQVLELLLRNIS